MSDSPERQPSLTPGFLPASKVTGRMMTNAIPPKPHLGWNSRGYLPHWDHPATIQSINFRLDDALPQSVLDAWQTELSLEALASCRSKNRPSNEVELRRRIEEYLDAGHGACWLRKPEIAQLVENALLHFDGQRYRLLAWCIMPNHVHTLIETREGFPLGKVLHSWKSFTSNEANKLLQRTGELWQRDYYDRYVRDAEHFDKVIAYIEENPVKAGLAKLKIDWRWSSSRFRARLGE